MPIQFRKTKRLGPLRLTMTGRGVTPSLRVGPVGYSPRRRRWSVSLPGPFTWFSRRRPR